MDGALKRQVPSGCSALELETTPVAQPDARFTIRPAFTRFLILALGLPAIFYFAHPYRGIYHDAVLYALQALRRIYPVELQDDLFFRHGSQDQFTVFSALYAPLIAKFGLAPAAAIVARGGVLCLYAAAWLLARRLMERESAWLALAIFILVPGSYGAFEVFRYGEDFATPRALAESLVLGSLALQLGGRSRLAMAGIGLALLVHPLMAFPGVLVGIFSVVSNRRREQLALLALIAAGLAMLVAWIAPFGALHLIDPVWRAILEQRVPYLLVDQWNLADWQPVLLTLASLFVTVLVLPTGRTRELAVGGIWVCLLGLALALLASSAQPLALLVQGQPWRWFWLGKAIAVLLLVPVGQTLWNRGHDGRGALALLGAAWFASDDPVGLFAAPLAFLGVFLMLRGDRAWGSRVAIGGPLLALFVVGSTWQIDNIEPKAVLALGVVALWWLFFRSAWRIPQVLALFATTAALGVEVLHAATESGPAYPPYPRFDTDTYAELAPWRARIAPAQTVYYPGMPMFCELLLHRKSYGGYVGVVFSRAAALDTDAIGKRISTWYPKPPKPVSLDPSTDPFPLTPTLLKRICTESEVSFVIARETLPMKNLAADLAPPWGRLHLYACADRPS